MADEKGVILTSAAAIVAVLHQDSILDATTQHQ